jgi:thiamine kinase-like enzyme
MFLEINHGRQTFKCKNIKRKNERKKSMSFIPSTPESVTAEWLSTVIGSRFPSNPIENVSVLKTHSGSTGRARLRITWAGKTSSDLPQTIFIKLPPEDEVQRQLVAWMGMGKHEARFYKELAPEVPLLTLQSIFSDYSSDGSQYIMVFDDLKASGGRNAAVPHDHTFDVAQQIVASLARMHGTYWNSSRFEKDLSWIKPHPVSSQKEVVLLIQQAVKNYADKMPATYPEIGKFFIDHQEAVVGLFERGTPTLTHGDAHFGNLFLNKDEKVGFLDWAFASKMPGMWDISYVLCNSFPPEFRRKNEKELLHLYMDHLAKSGGPARSFDDIWNEYRRYALYSWISLAITIGADARMQPLEFGLRSARWTTEALSDLDAIKLIKNELRAQ